MHTCDRVIVGDCSGTETIPLKILCGLASTPLDYTQFDGLRIKQDGGQMQIFGGLNKEQVEFVEVQMGEALTKTQ